MEKAHFEELHIVEKKQNEEEEIRVVTDKKTIKWDVQKYYLNLYKEEEKDIDMTEILRNINKMKKACPDDKRRLNRKISEEEVCRTLKETRNSVTPGSGGFGGNFYKVF